MTEYSQKIRVNRVQEPIVRVRVKPRVPPLEIGMQNTGAMVQWRLGTTGAWQDLIEIDDINSSVTVGSVTTLPAGSQATVTNVGTAQDVVLDFGIPEGGVSSVNGETGVVVIDAGDVPFTPTGGIAATTVQAALAELDSEKQPLDADLSAIAALTTATYGRALLTLLNATALAAEVDSFFLTPTEGNAAYQPLDSDLSAIAALTTTTFGRSLLTKTAAEDARDTLDTAPYVATRTALKALDTTKDTVAILTEAGREGVFVWTAANYSAHVTADTLEGVYVKATAIASSAGAWVRVTATGSFNVKWFGAVGDNSTNDIAAFRAAFAVAKAYGSGIYIPAASYVWALANTTETWDFTSVSTTGFTIEGEGLNNTIIRVTGMTTSGAIAWQLVSTADWYDLVLRAFDVRAVTDTVLVVVGKNDFSDPLNVATFDRFGVFCSLSSATNLEACRLNYVVNSNFIGCRFNGYANGSGTNVGTALRARQVQFCTFTNGSYGNAFRGVDFTDGFSYGNVFLGVDIENIGYCVSYRSTNAVRNVFIGGQYSLWTSYPFYSSTGDTTGSNMHINGNYSNGAGPTGKIDTANYIGVTIRDGTAITTPSVPATTVAKVNDTGYDVIVNWWAGTITGINLNGVAMTGATGSGLLKSGQSITLTYTGSPSWKWTAFK